MLILTCRQSVEKGASAMNRLLIGVCHNYVEWQLGQEPERRWPRQ